MLRVLAAGWLAITLAFWGMRVLPGDFATAELTTAGASQSAITERQRQLGLDRPLSEQYLHFMGGLITGDLGQSFKTGERVGDMLALRLRSTLQLASTALVISVVLGSSLAIATLSGHKSVRALASALSQLALSIPLIVSASLVVVAIGLFPPESPQNLLLAAGVLGFHAASSIAVTLSSSLHEAQASNAILTAHGKGLPPRLVLRRHILRLGIIPVIPVIAAQAAFLFGGTVITETLFSRTGLGRLMLDAVLSRDLPVVQGVTVIAVALTIVALLVSEVMQRLADPRLSL
jgi:peptide/nickel transport system permease protein